tara:strand:- start:371 stop:1483 length:1113 start_codon:yes stop_codon:yes gene_type:complete
MQVLTNILVSFNHKLLLFILFVALPSISLAAWEDETHLISKDGTESVVRGLKNEAILFRHKDPQKCVEWGMSNGLNTIVLAGEYIFDDRIDVPRPGVTLIVDKGAVFKLNPDTKHSTISFKASNPDYWGMIPFIYNKGHSNVEILMFGELVKYRWETKERGRQTMPIIFDGRNTKGDCGLSGGMMLVTGRATDSFWLIDSSDVKVPIVALDTGPGASLVLEGCEDCHLGMIVNLAAEPGGKTGETIDLNSRSIDITIERLIGERSYEIIDCNESHVIVDEAISVGIPQKLFGRGPVSGPRFTDRRSFGTRSLNVRKTTVLNDAIEARLIHDVPAFPESLPQFTVKTTVEIDFEENKKRRYSKAVQIDLRN